MLIDIPTRVSGESKTTADHVITNDIHKVIYPCVFLSDISDHLPVACLVASAPKSSTGMPKNNNSKENYMYRDTSHFDPDQFKMTLSNQFECFFRSLQLDTANRHVFLQIY